ncbi:unnamed protein product [Closterium sp. Yama58-4]|nr:unnamed protein product [Closterium sp. Yama58-4]
MAEIPQEERTGVDGEAEAEGTAVVVRMRSSKEGRDIRLDGTAQTVFAMQCHRCLCPVTEPIYSEFSLLLSASPLHEPTKRSLGVILDAPSSSFNSLPADYDDGDEGDMLDLDLDDKLYFPPDQRIIDVSKYVRDTVHLEIPLKVRCSPGCRGMCLGCGANLNVKACSCGEDEWGIGGSSGRGQATGSGQGQGLDGSRGDDLEQEAWSRRHGVGGTEQEARSRRHGAGGTEQEAWSRRHGAGGTEQEAWSRRHGAGGMEQEAWSRRHGAGDVGTEVAAGQHDPFSSDFMLVQ